MARGGGGGMRVRGGGNARYSPMTPSPTSPFCLIAIAVAAAALFFRRHYRPPSFRHPLRCRHADLAAIDILLSGFLPLPFSPLFAGCHSLRRHAVRLSTPAAFAIARPPPPLPPNTPPPFHGSIAAFDAAAEEALFVAGTRSSAALQDMRNGAQRGRGSVAVQRKDSTYAKAVKVTAQDV